ncbi:Peptidoglycan-N-acetylglucosamine deacetylase [compost metagenome]
MRLKYSLGLTAVTFLLSACGNQFSAQVERAVVDNKEAKSLSEWRSSAHNPEAIFSGWRDKVSDSPGSSEGMMGSICGSLADLDGEALSLFDEQIKEEANKPLLTACKENLILTLEKYYAAQRQILESSVDATQEKSSINSFKFPDNVQTRDLSAGYRAITGDVAKKEVVLTFDDGPSYEYTQSILRSLKEVNAKAMFFALGKNVRLNADVLKMVAADGHSVGSHSITHTCLGTSASCLRANGRNLTTAEAVAEIRGGHQAIYDVLGWVDPFFRFPYGESSPDLANYLKNNQVGEFYWAIDSEDWKAQSYENLLKKTLAQIDARGRGVVLFHDIQRRTAEVLPQFLRELYNRGFSVVLLQPADANAKYNSKLVTKPLP